MDDLDGGIFGFSLLKNALTGNKDWKPAWRKAEPKPSYDVIIMGGGGHGLSTAFYLAKEHGISNVAVIEKGWIGSGNVGRNTTIVRSNYLLPENMRFYEHSMKLWEDLCHELNYNVMFSQRGVLNLAHTPAQLDDFARRGNAMRHLDVDAELMTPAEIKQLCPARPVALGALPDHRRPDAGARRHRPPRRRRLGLCARRGPARRRHHRKLRGHRLHEGWRQNCRRDNHARRNPREARLPSRSPGIDRQVMRMAGVDKLPIESHVLQAFVTESLKPFLNTVRHLRHGAFVRVAVRQGRPRLWRRHRRLQFLCAARKPADRRGSAERDAGAFPEPRGPGAASWGGSSTCRWTAARSSPPARCRACI